jgi:hypothetical protein
MAAPALSIFFVKAKAKSRPKMRSHPRSFWPYTPLLQCLHACLVFPSDIARKFLILDGLYGQRGRTPLHEGAFSGKKNAAKSVMMLLDKGANKEAKDQVNLCL